MVCAEFHLDEVSNLLKVNAEITCAKSQLDNSKSVTCQPSSSNNILMSKFISLFCGTFCLFAKKCVYNY